MRWRRSLVAGLRQALLSPNYSGAAGVTGRPGDPTTLVVTWTGGACGDRASMNLDGRQTALQLFDRDRLAGRVQAGRH